MTKFNQGLTILEVLIALTLISIIFVSVDFSFNQRKEELQEVLDNFDRALNFAANEAVLRNSIIRIHFFLDKDPQEYALEYGTDADYVLPLFGKLADKDKLSLSELEKRKKLVENINKQFNLVLDFNENNLKLPDSIRIWGVATNRQEILYRDGQCSIYIYPSGERDASLIIAASNKEMGSLSISPFIDKTIREYYIISEKEKYKELFDRELDEKTISIYHQWIKVK